MHEDIQVCHLLLTNYQLLHYQEKIKKLNLNLKVKFQKFLEVPIKFHENPWFSKLKKNFLKTDANLAKQRNIVNNSIVANKSFLILKNKICLKICMIKFIYLYETLLRNT